MFSSIVLRKELIWLVVIVAAFVILRLPAVNHSYYQDEYKWSFIVDPSTEYYDPGRIPHPPLGTLIYEYGGRAFGFDHMRAVPLVFGVANLILLFFLSRIIFERKAAFWAAGLFAISFFSVLASLTVDTDGAIMPFFFLIMAIGYFQLRKINFQFSIFNFQISRWWLLLILGAAGGFLIKISFGAAVAALILDFSIQNKIFADKKKFIKFAVWAISLGVAFVILLWASGFIFTSFRLDSSLEYWQHFVNFKSRAWLQVFIQVVKSALFASPLLLLPLVFSDREIFAKARPLFLFAFVGLFFYIVAFDFSASALDRYLQFTIAPLCVIAGAIFSKYMNHELRIMNYAPPIFISLLIFFLQFSGHSVPSLYPKTEWIERMLSLKWNFLYPFSGGSGPTPFYVSFAFMGLLWIVGAIFVLLALRKKISGKGALLAVFILGLTYNLTFIEEYDLGKINGSSQSLIKEAVSFIAENRAITKVTTYNDIGGGEIVRLNKYRKRLYVDPKFDVNEKVKSLNQYKEHYLHIDIPHLDPESVYQKYYDSCEVIYENQSGRIKSFVYDCHNAPDIKNE